MKMWMWRWAVVVLLCVIAIRLIVPSPVKAYALGWATISSTPCDHIKAIAVSPQGRYVIVCEEQDDTIFYKI